MIPKIIQIHWFFDNMPHWVKKAINAYREFFPDWDVRVYTKVPSDMPEEYLDVMRQAPHSRLRADLIRWWLLYRDGGVYVDADTVPNKDFSPLLEHQCFFSRLGMSPWIDIFFVGAEPGLQLFKDALDNAQNFRDGKNPNTYFYLENLVPDVREREGVTILPKSAVYESKRYDAYKFLETDRLPPQRPQDGFYIWHFCNFRARINPLRFSLLEEQADEQKDWLQERYGQPWTWQYQRHPDKESPRKGVSLRKMPNGDLVCDPGGPEPETPEGYVQDKQEWYRFHPVDK